jgi:hypothetical protein
MKTFIFLKDERAILKEEFLSMISIWDIDEKAGK